MLTRDGYSTREIKIRIAIVKEVFNRKISLLASKLNIELKNKLNLNTNKTGAKVFREL